jgi:DNA recombination protein RmuC
MWDMNTFILAIILVVAFAGNAVFMWMLSKRKPPEENNMDGGLMLLQNQLQDLSKTLDRRIGESNAEIHQSVRAQLGESARLIKEITVEITSVKEIGRQTQGFAEQLQSLQDILKNPKQRGILGEYYLEALLQNILPPTQFKMQYPFKNGEIVDAAVFVKDKIIPIDSKFSLENYNRISEARDPSEKERLKKLFLNDLKLRIQETSKYIRPEEGTMDFAFMFIPHEAIYYDLLMDKPGMATDDTENLIQRAAGKYKVIIVSPTSFLAYLQTVLQGLKAMQIEETAKDIIKRVAELSKHLGAYGEYHAKLGNSLSTVINHYNASGKEFKKIDKDVLRITGDSAGIEVLQLERPDFDE